MVDELIRMGKLECLIGETSKYNSKYFLFNYTSNYLDYFGDGYHGGFGYTIFLMENGKLDPVFDFEVGPLKETDFDFKKGIYFLQNKKVNQIYTLESKEYWFEFDFASRSIGTTWEKSYDKNLNETEVEELKRAGIELVILEQASDFDIRFEKLQKSLGLLSKPQRNLDDFGLSYV